ncbi:Histone acetyltransferase HPA2 -related acetyltransferase [Collimonas arenae]|uniref:Histone acetyltransferase HPA2-related acetyltransferase n=1 Tax=Collimonas arenae TaxID=279058 RepID=A0A0A1F800_9BURK|nr:GNAT family N-acetyltransferase [Collimonas arenae]AIY39920.1 Histone acetyltransferase HPA2 -related acetyltransferase [Collimonas arenae]
MEELRITTEPAELDIPSIHRFLSEESAWARGIPLAMVEESIRHSLNFGLFAGDRQVAYARVVTDYATFAYLVDVFVLAEQRGKGYSAQLMTAVMAHPRLQGLRRFMLATSTAHGLYAKFGFSAPARPQTLMERFAPDAYAAMSTRPD